MVVAEFVAEAAMAAGVDAGKPAGSQSHGAKPRNF